MVLSLRTRVWGAAFGRRVWPLLAAIALAGCAPDGQPILNAAQPRGASVAFESIDGPPPAQFSRLVENLNTEAQSRRLAVISHDKPAAYRVRGYLAAKVAKGATTVSWVWDVFDREQYRALRISGEETVNTHTLGRQRDAWAVADDAMLHRIARSSMDQLAAFLTSPEVAPSAPAEPAPAAAPQIALIGQHDTSPEAAGIFRIFKPQADPLPETEDAAPAPVHAKAAAVPLPRPRPTATPAASPALSARETLTLAAARR
jgi:hypothetical protein